MRVGDFLKKNGFVSDGLPEPVQAQEAPPSVVRPIVTSAGPNSLATVALSPEDEQRFRALEAQVYAVPSTFTIFNNVRQKMLAFTVSDPMAWY